MTTEFTAAPAALAMVINHFNPEFELNRENEFKIWQSAVNLPTRAASIFGLAVFAKKQELNPKIILENRDYEFPDYRFQGYKKIEIDEAEFSRSMHVKQAAELNIPIEEMEINLELVEKLLKQGKILLIRLNAGVFRDTGSISNYVIIYAKKGENFSVIDTKIGKLEVKAEDIEKALKTLSLKKKRSSKMLVF